MENAKQTEAEYFPSCSAARADGCVLRHCYLSQMVSLSADGLRRESFLSAAENSDEIQLNSTNVEVERGCVPAVCLSIG